MLNLDLQNLFKIDATHGLSQEEIQSKVSMIPEYLNKIKDRDQDFYKTIDDLDVVEKINNYAQSIEGQFDDIVLLGIGGSSLGPICLQQSLKHLYEHELKDRKYPKLHVLDNIDPALIQATEDIINYERTLFIVITKSGGTPETLSQYFYFRDQADQKKLDAKKHFVFVTDPMKGLLRRISEEEGITAFDVPPKVGGRFSVLTAVGLLPARLIGINIEELLEGARVMRDSFLSEDYDNNYSFQLAAIQYLLGEKGKIMNIMWPYNQKLVRFADWFRQLLAESIGKKVNDQGEEVHVGLTPVFALGATDQHSQSQLYNEGPNDKFFIFIDVKNLGPEIKIPNLFPEEEVVDYLKDVSFNKLLQTEKEGTAGALNKNDRPNITIQIETVNERFLGELFMLFEGATAFLGEFYGINAFDQPGVELSKNLTKEMLRK